MMALYPYKIPTIRAPYNVPSCPLSAFADNHLSLETEGGGWSRDPFVPRIALSRATRVESETLAASPTPSFPLLAAVGESCRANLCGPQGWRWRGSLRCCSFGWRVAHPSRDLEAAVGNQGGGGAVPAASTGGDTHVLKRRVWARRAEAGSLCPGWAW